MQDCIEWVPHFSWFLITTCIFSPPLFYSYHFLRVRNLSLMLVLGFDVWGMYLWFISFPHYQLIFCLLLRQMKICFLIIFCYNYLFINNQLLTLYAMLIHMLLTVECYSILWLCFLSLKVIIISLLIYLHSFFCTQC